MSSDNVIEFPKKTNCPDEAQPFDWQGYVTNVRKIQDGFNTLNAYEKSVAFNVVANAFVEILERVFKDPVVVDTTVINKEEKDFE